MNRIAQALQRIKANVENARPESTLRPLAADLSRTSYDRTRTPVVTTYRFLQQVLHGNTAVGHLRHLGGLDFTDSASCQARQRLPVGCFHRLHQAVLAPCRRQADRGHARRWHGHRVFGLDGSRFSRADVEELQQAFGPPSGPAEGCGCRTADRLVPFDLRDGFRLRAVAAPWRTHDLRQAAVMHQDLGPDDVLLGDRAFGCYAHRALCVRRGLHGRCRAHPKVIRSCRRRRRHVGSGKVRPEQAGLPRSRWIKKRGKNDPVVESFQPKDKPAWMTTEPYAALPEAIVVRQRRFAVRVPGRRTRVITLVTTLLDPKAYPAKDRARRYEPRWHVDISHPHYPSSDNRYRGRRAA